MSALDPAAAILQRGNEHALHSQRLDADARANDVRDGVERAYFVKGNLLGGLPVNLPFRHRNAPEDGNRAGLHEIGEIAGLNQRADGRKRAGMGVGMAVMRMGVFMSVFVPVLVPVVPARALVLVMGVRRAFVDGELHPLDGLAAFPLEVHVEIADLELGKFPLAGGGLHAKVAVPPTISPIAVATVPARAGLHGGYERRRRRALQPGAGL